MSLLANSYGDTGEIASLTPRFANSSIVFDGTTRPTLTNVESFCDQTSAMMNSILSENGFSIPVTQADVKLMLDMFVNQEVAAIAEGVNGSGRFGPSTKTPAKGRFQIMMDDVIAFVKGNAAGMAQLGAARPNSTVQSIGYRDGDNSGDDVSPMFQRKAFGNVIQDWDAI